MAKVFLSCSQKAMIRRAYRSAPVIGHVHESVAMFRRAIRGEAEAQAKGKSESVQGKNSGQNVTANGEYKESTITVLKLENGGLMFVSDSRRTKKVDLVPRVVRLFTPKGVEELLQNTVLGLVKKYYEFLTPNFGRSILLVYKMLKVEPVVDGEKHHPYLVPDVDVDLLERVLEYESGVMYVIQNVKSKLCKLSSINVKSTLKLAECALILALHE